jgi:dihydrofolate reductase
MRKLIYPHMVSLDGYIETDGTDKPSDWATGDEELTRHFIDFEATTDAHLYGRRIYEQLARDWPAMGEHPSAPPYVAEYARLWMAKPKIVFSRSLTHVEWNARLADDAAAEITRLKEEPGGDLAIYGANLVAGLLPLGLIDEIRAYVNPVLLCGGKPMFPQLDNIIRLDLIESRAFGCGVVLLRYGVRHGN